MFEKQAFASFFLFSLSKILKENLKIKDKSELSVEIGFLIKLIIFSIEKNIWR